MTAPSTEPPLRRDAQRNRDALLEAAHAVFGERGIDASVDEIARRAGVGVGTLYRRFPHKDDLIAAIFEQRLGDLAAVAADALDDPDPWQGLVRFLEALGELQASDRGFKDIIAHTLDREGSLTPARLRIRTLNGQLVARAQAAGVLRGDVTAEDVSILCLALGSVIQATSAIAPDVWRRSLALSMDGLREGSAGAPLLHPPLSAEQLDRAMQAEPDAAAGAVSHKCVPHAKCPVLVVPHAQRP